MLHFTFSTVLMALLTSNILAVLIAVLFLRGKTMARLGYKVLAFFVLLTVIRLLIPYEFPFSTNINLPHLLSKMISFFLEYRISILTIPLSLWNLFEMIWIVGIIIHLVLYIHDYRHTKNYIQKYGQDKTDEPKYQEILEKICSKRGKRNCFRVIELPNLAFPIVFGVSLQQKCQNFSLKMSNLFFRALFYRNSHSCSCFTCVYIYLNHSLLIIKT